MFTIIRLYLGWLQSDALYTEGGDFENHCSREPCNRIYSLKVYLNMYLIGLKLHFKQTKVMRKGFNQFIKKKVSEK